VIGILLGISGLIDGALQTLFFAPVVNRMGAKRTFQMASAFYTPISVTFPAMPRMVSLRGVDAVVWVLLVLQLAFQVVKDMTFAAL